MGEHTAEDRGVEGSIPSRPILGSNTRKSRANNSL